MNQGLYVTLKNEVKGQMFSVCVLNKGQIIKMYLKAEILELHQTRELERIDKENNVSACDLEGQK